MHVDVNTINYFYISQTRDSPITLGCMEAVVTRTFFFEKRCCYWSLILSTLTFDLCALENVGRLVTPAKKLEDTIRLAELVIEVLQQNEEHHAEVRALTSGQLTVLFRRCDVISFGFFQSC